MIKFRFNFLARLHHRWPNSRYVVFDSPCFYDLLSRSVQSLSRVWLFATPWIAARQASLSITNSQSSLRLMSIESVIPSNHLILCCPLLLLPPIPPSIRVFSSESTLRMRWPKYWSFIDYNRWPSRPHDWQLVLFHVGRYLCDCNGESNKKSWERGNTIS